MATVHVNANGTEDLGLMQVNTLWLAVLSRYTGASAATVREQLLGRPCYNIAAAGYILRSYLNEAGGNLMQAIGDYHSHTPPLNQAYQARVMASASRLFSSGRR